jgi:hypothetical protein
MVTGPVLLTKRMVFSAASELYMRKMVLGIGLSALWPQRIPSVENHNYKSLCFGDVSNL